MNIVTKYNIGDRVYFINELQKKQQTCYIVDKIDIKCSDSYNSNAIVITYACLNGWRECEFNEDEIVNEETFDMLLDIVKGQSQNV